jgi:hypothetical protein
MKDLIKKILKEETEEVFEIPSINFFPDGVEGLKKLIEDKNIKRWSLDDDLDLSDYEGDLTWLKGLVYIEGSLDLRFTQIESLGNLESVNRGLNLFGTRIKSLGNLQLVGGYLNLKLTPITSFGDLEFVGGDLWLNKFLSERYTDKEIKKMIDVINIYRS